MKNIVSFCLWGDKPVYVMGAVKNAELVKQFYPEFTSRFYIDKDTVPPNVINLLKTTGSEIVLRDKGGWHSMFWRFEPAGEDDVDIVLSRDTDCRISGREVQAVREWLKSDKDFHVMRDHPSHDMPILGGLWGARNGVIKHICEEMQSFNKADRYQIDQQFLKRRIWPVVKNNVWEHDSCWRKRIPFPTKRRGLEFVGEAFTENDKPLNPGHRVLLQRYINRHGDNIL